MTLKNEIYQDVVDNCDIILALLQDYELTNDTPEGRMIYQCRWLKEQVAKNALPLPVEDYVHTLKHVYSERYLEHLSSDSEHYKKEVEIYLYRLLNLIEGKLLLKPIYYSYAIRCIEALLTLLRTSSRPLDKYEQGLVGELVYLKQSLQNGEIEPPLINYVPDYPNFRKVYRISRSSLDDVSGGKTLTKTVANLLFEGVRPNAWVTPEDADRETAGL